jgi:hypothetical protein
MPEDPCGLEAGSGQKGRMVYNGASQAGARSKSWPAPLTQGTRLAWATVSSQAPYQEKDPKGLRPCSCQNRRAEYR